MHDSDENLERSFAFYGVFESTEFGGLNTISCKSICTRDVWGLMKTGKCS